MERRKEITVRFEQIIQVYPWRSAKDCMGQDIKEKTKNISKIMLRNLR